jgi:hypothetical protein
MPITHNLTIMRRKALSLVGGLSFLALMLPATNSTAAAQTELPEAHAGLGAPIEGSWIFTINLTQQGITFTARGTFRLVPRELCPRIQSNYQRCCLLNRRVGVWPGLMSTQPLDAEARSALYRILLPLRFRPNSP